MELRKQWSLQSAPTSLAYLVDDLLTTWLINPFVACTVMATLGSFSLMHSSHMFIEYGSVVFFESVPSSACNLCHHLLDLLFVFRFPSRATKGLLVQSNIVFEGLLFVVCNAITIWMATHSSMLPGFEKSVFLRVVIVCSLICPYGILCVDLIDVMVGATDENEKMTLRAAPPERRKWFPRITRFLVDINNAFLAVMIAQSFALIHVDIPFLESDLLSTAYVACSYLFKLHLVHMLVLYETVLSVFEIDDLVAYSELYMPVRIHEPRGWLHQIKRHKTAVMAIWASAIAIYSWILLVLACVR